MKKFILIIIFTMLVLLIHRTILSFDMYDTTLQTTIAGTTAMLGALTINFILEPTKDDKK